MEEQKRTRRTRQSFSVAERVKMRQLWTEGKIKHRKDVTEFDKAVGELYGRKPKAIAALRCKLGLVFKKNGNGAHKVAVKKYVSDDKEPAKKVRYCPNCGMSLQAWR